MNKLPVIAFATVLLLAGSPAHSKSQTTFAAERTFQQCTQTTIFACNKISPTGERYGTAHSRTMCSTYKFLSNGTVELADYPGLWEEGRYRISGDTVYIKRLDKRGKVVGKFTLTLSRDGKMLGEMTRLDEKSRPQADQR